jgi:hypothetical protein
MTRFSIPVLLLAVGLVGCDTTATQPETQIVVEAYLQGGAPLPNIRLTRSVETDEAYQPSEVGVTGARVEVRRLADDGTTAATTSYVETDQGVYGPDPPVPTVRPLTTYALSVETFEGTTVTATTTVPDTISIVKAQNATVPYQSPEQPTFTITAPQTDRDGQAVLVLTNTSLLDFRRPNDQLREGLTPFYEEGYDPEEDSIDTFRTTSSGILNEANFDSDEQGRITARLPWISVAFYGPNETTVHVIDDNFYDLIRSQQAQSTGGQGGLAPGEIPNVIEHVEGGTGVFASYVQDAQRVFVQCLPSQDECPSYISR